VLTLNTKNNFLCSGPLAHDPGHPAKRSVSSAFETLFDALSLRASEPEQSSSLCDNASSTAPDNFKSILERSLLHHQMSTPAPVYTAGIKHMATEEIIERRNNLLGPNMALFFADQPLHIVKGRGCELFDSEGNSYLDCKSTSLLSGNSHPLLLLLLLLHFFEVNCSHNILQFPFPQFLQALIMFLM
jgi:hypothetical protein